MFNPMIVDFDPPFQALPPWLPLFEIQLMSIVKNIFVEEASQFSVWPSILHPDDTDVGSQFRS